MSPTLTILHRDDHLVAVHKPAGLLVHRSALARGEREFLLQRLRDQLGRRVYPVHRLDRPTSGVMVFALSPEVATQLAEAFSQRLVAKRYLAVVRGIGPEQERLAYPLREEDGSRPKAEMPAMEAYRLVLRCGLDASMSGLFERFGWVAHLPVDGVHHASLDPLTLNDQEA